MGKLLSSPTGSIGQMLPGSPGTGGDRRHAIHRGRHQETLGPTEPHVMPISKVQVLEQVDRIEQFDGEGGGTIVRTFYCEPYSSRQAVMTALKGTVRPTAIDPAIYERVLPHNDPDSPNFYCTNVKSVPFAREAIAACRRTGFDATNDDNRPTANGQITALKQALNNIDDFDFSNNPDDLTPVQLMDGGSAPTQGGITRRTLRGFRHGHLQPPDLCGRHTGHAGDGDLERRLGFRFRRSLVQAHSKKRTDRPQHGGRGGGPHPRS